LHAQVVFLSDSLAQATSEMPSQSKTPRQPFDAHIDWLAEQPKDWSRMHLSLLSWRVTWQESAPRAKAADASTTKKTKLFIFVNFEIHFLAEKF